jgi:1-acyl-sn-glycerol-3-phosphate acyltransferase
VVEAGVVAASTIAAAPPIVVLALVGQRERARSLALGWCRQVLARLGVAMETRGFDRLPEKGGWVAVANHCSRFDGRCLYLAFEGRVDFAVSRRLALTPFFGQALLALGCIAIDRLRTAASLKRLQRLVEPVRRGRRVLFFPEGRRTGGGAMLPFKSGAFILAVEAGVPLVPVAVVECGSMGRGPIEVVVGSAISTAGCGRDDVPRLKNECRAAIESMAASAETDFECPAQPETTRPASRAMMRSARSASVG